MDQILIGIKGTICYLVDIFIGGSAIMEKCKDKLLIVLERLNKHKCKLLETKTNYLRLAKKGISPNSEKEKAI